MAMDTQLAARIEQTIHGEQLQNLFPTHRFPAFGQTLLPELIQTELAPEFTSEPAVAEDARTLQFQAAHADLDAVDGIGRKFPVIGKQTHGGETLFGFIEYIERLPPCGLLAVIDLAEIENGALRCLAAR